MPSSSLSHVSRRIAAINLGRAWWLLVITTMISLGIAGLTQLVGFQIPIGPVLFIDFGGSLAFFILLFLARRDRLGIWLAGRLPLAYAIFFVLLSDGYYFSLLPVFGDNAGYVFGVLTPSALLLLPPRVFLPFLAVNHVVFVTVLYASNQTPKVLTAGTAGGTVAVIIAGVCCAFQYRAKTAELLKEAVIARKNRELAAANACLTRKTNQLDELMAVAAHDLRSPLLALESLCAFEKRETAWQQPPYSQFLGTVLAGTRSMVDLVNRLLLENRTRHQPGTQGAVAICDLAMFLPEAALRAQPLALQKQIRIIVTNPHEEALVEVPADALDRVLDNLLSNAIKFSPPGSLVQLCLLRSGGEWTCEIRDEGPGIAPEDRGSLFQKFEQGRNQPTAGEPSSGLGLYISKNLVQEMKGTLEYEPHVPKGSIFRISLPAEPLDADGKKL